MADHRRRAKAVYLHGRPGPHPLHQRFAEAISADFRPVDLRLRWQDRSRSRPYVALSWLLNAATLPDRKSYDVFLVDGLHIGPVVMKKLFLRSDQKIVADLASHTLYFLLTHRFSRPVEDLHLWALRRYDALICEGRMAVDIVTELLGDEHPPIYETRGGVDDAKALTLASIEPDLAGRRMVFVGGGPAEFRSHYKGLDLMVDAFAIAAKADPELRFDIVGHWDAAVIEGLQARVAEPDRSRIHFLGTVADADGLGRAFSRSALYVHCSRGDAFPGASIESMMAGVVPLVSEWTGTKQLVEQVDPRLVTPLDAVELASRITWYFAQSLDERRRLSRRAREVAAPYTATAAAEHYAAVFQRVCEDLGAPSSILAA